ncbi:carboxypeptidase B-like isoform X1 [Frieseomelitta varia]|uniref:carboxypeptidase B-like isoform X1 n=1 Tax=Frieseomelitta varia TaxID=561572 RepID=UPI001CB6A11A|nr:carboxypeptidase B-like isoform X1 [Frieseomelitta varia]
MRKAGGSHGARFVAIASLLLLVVLAFVDASVIHRQKREFVIPDWIEIVDEPVQAENSKTIQRAVRVRDAKVTYDGAQVWRVRSSEGQKDLLSNVTTDFQDTGLPSLWTRNDTTVDVMVRLEEIPRLSRYLKQKDLEYQVVIEDLQKAIDEENPSLSEQEMEELEGRKARYAWWQGVARVPSIYSRPRPLRYPVASAHGVGGHWHFRGHRMEWSSYHRLEDIHGYMDYLAETFPDVCSVVSIGNSVEGRPLKVIRISNGKANAPALWIDGGIHAREWISPAAVTYIINHLVENSEDLEADYYILPVANPDGYEYTFTRDRLWRKNRKRSVGSPCTGVDLNRNFGYRWGGLGTSKDPCREIYAGSGPFSEPETNAIRYFFEASAANFKAYLTFHSYGQYILYPWGYDKRVPPDYADLEMVGKQVAAAIKKAGGANSVYTVGNSATTLYAASGGSDDWAKAILKIKYAYTIELRDTGKYGFVLPARYITPTAKEALAAVMVVTEACKSL